MSNQRAVETATDFSEAARRRLLSKRGEPLFLADWLRPVFVHYEVPVDALQRDVPFDLDLRNGKAYVSLVAFTMRRMRPFRGGRLTECFFKPIATADYLNFRTYVRHHGEPGIYFLTEWMNNPLSVRLGPWTFGLPHRFGELNYQHQYTSLNNTVENEEHTRLACGLRRPAANIVTPSSLLHNVTGTVRETNHGPTFQYEARLENSTFAPCPTASLDEFLLERYTAFTTHRTKRRFFRIWHRPWAQQAIQVSVSDVSLIEKVWPWFADATLVSANFSPGARDVWMGRPHRDAARLRPTIQFD